MANPPRRGGKDGGLMPSTGLGGAQPGRHGRNLYGKADLLASARNLLRREDETGCGGAELA